MGLNHSYRLVVLVFIVAVVFMNLFADVQQADAEQSLVLAADMVRGHENPMGPVCALTSRYRQGEMVTWRAHIIDRGMDKAAKGDDELSFRNGKFYSAGCAKWGFGDGVYTARVEGDSIHFEAENSSPKHGKIVWNGKVRGNIMEATPIWTKERWYWKDARRESWFKGTLKRQQEPGHSWIAYHMD